MERCSQESETGFNLLVFVGGSLPASMTGLLGSWRLQFFQYKILRVKLNTILTEACSISSSRVTEMIKNLMSFVNTHSLYFRSLW